MDLTAEQKEKVAALEADYTKALAKCREVVTPAVMKEIQTAEKKARDAGTKKKDEIQKAVEAAVTLTAEQKEALAKLREVETATRKALIGLLTPEQVEKAGLKGGKKKNP